MTVLVGTNNAGKTTVLDALAAILAFRGGLAFSEHDFRSTDPSRSARSAPPIEVEVEIAPSTGPRFLPGELGQQTAQVVASGDKRYFLRLDTRWNADPTVAGLGLRTSRPRRADCDPSTDFNLCVIEREYSIETVRSSFDSNQVDQAHHVCRLATCAPERPRAHRHRSVLTGDPGADHFDKTAKEKITVGATARAPFVYLE